MGTTTISVQKDTKDRFDDLRPEGAASADEFLGVLLDHYDDPDAPYDQPREDTARGVVAVLRDELGIEGDADLPTIIREELGSGGGVDTEQLFQAGDDEPVGEVLAWSGEDGPEWTRAEIDEALDRIEGKVEEAAASAETAEQRAGSIERMLEDLQ